MSDLTSIKDEAPAVRNEVITDCMLLLCKQKKPEKAVQAAELLAEWATLSNDVYNAACAYSLCIPLVESKETRGQYAKRAVQLLRQAAAKGFNEVEKYRQDSDLDALRQHPDFNNFLAEVEKKLT